MTTLSESCNKFADALEELEPADADLPARLKGLITWLVRGASEHVAEHSMGEVAAIVQRCHEALSTLSAERGDPDDRRSRYRSRAAVPNLLIMVDGVARFHQGKQKPANVAALRELVADALSGLVEPEE